MAAIPLTRRWSQRVSRGDKPFQSELHALAVVVADVIIYARVERIKAIGCRKMEILSFRVPKALSVAALSQHSR
jgi:hypothetical protein